MDRKGKEQLIEGQISLYCEQCFTSWPTIIEFSLCLLMDLNQHTRMHLGFKTT